MIHPSRSQLEQLLHPRRNSNALALAAAGTRVTEGQAGTAASSASLRPKIDVILTPTTSSLSQLLWRLEMDSAARGASPHTGQEG